MSTMLALHQNEHGDLSSFKLGQLPKPSPGPSEVLLRVHAASINPVDMKRTHLNLPENFPVVIGYDVAGVVEAVGADVTRFRAGDQVFGDVLADSVGLKVTGTVAEYCTCRADLLALVPPGVSFTQAAAVPLVAQTAIEALELAGTKSGDRVFVTGGAGGVGVHLMQVAKAMFGVGEIATTASSAKTDFVKQHGADIVVNYKKDDAGEVLKGWADIVVDCTGEVDMEKRVVKEGGCIVSIVNFSEPDVKGLMLKPNQEMMEKIAGMLKDGQLVAVVDTVYSMQDAIKAVEHVANGRARGKVVVQIVD